MQDFKALQDLSEVCIENWKQFINPQCLCYKYLEHHCLMTPQRTITVGLSGVTDRLPVTIENFLFELGFKFLQVSS